MSGELTTLEPPAPIQREAATVIDVIARAAADPSIDVNKLERLLVIQQQIMADQRRTAFMGALARLQEKLPQIAKSGTILDRDGKERNRFAKIEDIDRVIRPMCAKEGFSFAFDSQPGASGIQYSCTMAHRDGHSETKMLTLPVDAGAGRNAVQSIGSTTSYARRYLLGMHLNLVTRDEDDDGSAHGAEPVTPEQAAHLRAECARVGGNEARFLNWLAAPSFEEIRAANYSRAVKFLEEKGRQKR
jgi:ERF superfamily protein